MASGAVVTAIVTLPQKFYNKSIYIEKLFHFILNSHDFTLFLDFFIRDLIILLVLLVPGTAVIYSLIAIDKYAKILHLVMEQEGLVAARSLSDSLKTRGQLGSYSLIFAILVIILGFITQ